MAPLRGPPLSACTSFYTPGPIYASFEDSPFNGLKENNTYFYIEDFEDGKFNVPGIAVSPPGNFVAKKGSTNFIDSVDADDGEIDGDGSRGASFSTSRVEEFTFFFDKKVLGRLPTHVGMVFTDVSSNKKELVTLEAFGPGQRFLGKATKKAGADEHGGGGNVDDDEFFGVVSLSGISAVKIQCAVGNWELDHIQFGRRY